MLTRNFKRFSWTEVPSVLYTVGMRWPQSIGRSGERQLTKTGKWVEIKWWVVSEKETHTRVWHCVGSRYDVPWLSPSTSSFSGWGVISNLGLPLRSPAPTVSYVAHVFFCFCQDSPRDDDKSDTRRCHSVTIFVRRRTCCSGVLVGRPCRVASVSQSWTVVINLLPCNYTCAPGGGWQRFN